MNLVVVLAGAFVFGIAAVALLAPLWLRTTLLAWQSPSRFYAAVAIRLIAGVLFLLAAPETRYPTAIYVFGGIMVLAGVFLLAIGRVRMDRMIERLLPDKGGVIRLYALAALALGAFLVYAGM